MRGDRELTNGPASSYVESFTDKLNMRLHGHKKKVCLEQNISIGSHLLLHFTTFHNVSIHVKCPKKLVMRGEYEVSIARR